MLFRSNREHKIKQKHEQILKVFQSLVDIFGNIPAEDIDFSNVPFKFKDDAKLHTINEIVIDTAVPGLKINDNSIIYAQYSLNKYFPELQWTSEHDAPNRQLIYRGLPKPPSLAKWVGSDYKPSGWSVLSKIFSISGLAKRSLIFCVKPVGIPPHFLNLFQISIE